MTLLSNIYNLNSFLRQFLNSGDLLYLVSKLNTAYAKLCTFFGTPGISIYVYDILAPVLTRVNDISLSNLQ